MVEFKETKKGGYAITMTRGDTLRKKIDVVDMYGTPYTPQEGDSIRFACKHDYNDTECLIYKEIPYDTLLLQLDPEDTKEMNQPDIYVFDIQLTTADGTVTTFVKGKLRILEEVE